jgi:hypothetical protein
VQNADSSLFDDLDVALQSGSSEKRVAMLRKVTDLFLSEADRLNEEQIGVFDGVLVQLIDRIETRTLAEISERLAPVANAPIDLTLNLARHSEIGCQSAFKFDPVSASNFDPLERRVLTVALASSELAGVAETRRARVV